MCRDSPLQHAALGEIAHHLLGEERIAGRASGDRSADRGRPTGRMPSSSVEQRRRFRESLSGRKRNRLRAGNMGQRARGTRGGR